MDDGKGRRPDANGLPLHDYEALLADASPVGFQVDDESAAASMCYTSGTTGNPKGVVYSHRSSYLHTMGGCWPTASACASPTASCPWCRCSTPMPGAWPTPRWRRAPTS
jgi:fatty-acyl-CoA synthase